MIYTHLIYLIRHSHVYTHIYYTLLYFTLLDQRPGQRVPGGRQPPPERADRVDRLAPALPRQVSPPGRGQQPAQAPDAVCLVLFNTLKCFFGSEGHVALDTLLLRLIPGDLLSAFPHRQFHTLPGLLDSWTALPNSNPNAGRQFVPFL